MEKLLALYKIKTVGFVDSNNVVHKFAFTSKMLAHSIFIEYFTVDEFPAEEEDEDSGYEELDDDTESPEYGSRLSVIMEHKGKYYDFLMFHNSVEIGAPIILLQTIIFLVKLIDETQLDQLIEYLTDVAPNPLIPHEIAEKSFRDVANVLIKEKLKNVRRLIQDDNAASN